MRSYFYVCAAAGGVLLLAGCGGQLLSRAEQAEPSGSAFEQNLYTGYLGLARAEYDEGDYRDSDAFALRATQAAQGGEIAPEAIEARSLPADSVDDLDAARARLLGALESGAAEREPVHAANAQVMFDCWMQEQEENRQPNDINQCRDGFSAAIGALEPAMAALPTPKPIRFSVYFDNNTAALTEAAQAVIAEARIAARKLDGGIIKVSGNADKAGSADYNKILSALRADAVAKMLADGQLPVAAVLTEAYGEAQPAVVTADGVSEPRNRRVDIILEP